MINAMCIRERQKRQLNIAEILSNNQKLSNLDNQFFQRLKKIISDGHDAGTRVGVKA